MADDLFDLARFVAAQASVIDTAMAELQAGTKRSHWMWFVFPQIGGLGSSPMAIRYAIKSLAEAQAYATHPLLGARLRDCTARVVSHGGRSARAVFGPPDDMKFRSSMTLFARAAPDEPLFSTALATFFDGKPDEATLKRLA